MKPFRMLLSALFLTQLAACGGLEEDVVNEDALKEGDVADVPGEDADGAGSVQQAAVYYGWVYETLDCDWGTWPTATYFCQRRGWLDGWVYSQTACYTNSLGLRVKQVTFRCYDKT
jgi:hypothetical protein